MLAMLLPILLLVYYVAGVPPPLYRDDLSIETSINVVNASLGSGLSALDCFTPALGPHLLPTVYLDCRNAAQQFLSEMAGYHYRPKRFARKGRGGIRVPKVVRNATCSIKIDVTSDKDQEVVQPRVIYETALSLAAICLGSGSDRLGGSKAVGPNRLLNVAIFGRSSSDAEEDEVDPFLPEGLNNRNAFAIDENHASFNRLENTGQSSISEPAHIIPRAEGNAAEPSPSQDVNLEHKRFILGGPDREGSQIMNATWRTLNGSSMKGFLNLGGTLECYDPPSERERLYPIKVADCEQATMQIIGGKNKWQQYIFSRHPPVDHLIPYFPMPAKYTHGTCVVSLDTEKDDDEDIVRVMFVESSAWVLAHKCSGNEEPQQKYGGTTTVGVGATDMIRVWVYGRPRPPSLRGDRLSSLSQNISSINDEW